MKKHYTITISDRHGSSFFSLGKNIKRSVILAGLALFSVLVSAFFSSISQSYRVDFLSDEIAVRDNTVDQLDSLTLQLNETIGSQRQLIANVSDELFDIEDLSGIHLNREIEALEERIKNIKRFYSMKEEEYVAIESRVMRIEEMIGLNNPEGKIQNIDVSARVETATLKAGQERMFYDNIPNGFPTKARKITSKFGSRIHPVTKVKSFHKGVDLRAKTGQDIYATADGIVVSADYSKLSGNRVVLRHNFGFETRYSHLKKTKVEAGDIVQKGDLIGLSGNTGLSSAPHLHYEIRYLGKPVDPKQFLTWEFGSHEIFTQVRGIQWPSLITLINKQIFHQTLQLSQLDPSLQEKLN